jgi:phospholipase C
MQENRSFDHAYGMLKGVRGFSDPRAIKLRNGLPVWLQADRKNNIYSPFHLGLTETKSTWMGAVPHSRHTQVDAYNEGRHDNWIEAKKLSKELAHIPLTMGYYSRNDIPFNYALADAFTICDQNFCSVMSSTWPNRFYFWTGTVRHDQHADSKAEMRNELPMAAGTWPTFPELLEDANIPWKIYQNDVSCGGGFSGEERSWLANFSCNPLERFKNYNVKFSDRYVTGLKNQIQNLPTEISKLEDKLKNTTTERSAQDKIHQAIAEKKKVLKQAQKELSIWSEANFNELSQKEKNLYQKAFSTNKGDPNYRKLAKLSYTDDNGKSRQLDVPEGDVLHQFRQDVQQGKLPTVSWVVPAQRYSDHPSSPWYGSWYISEIMDILTQDPKVWQKTIFILTYDENDGYFDHIPPFIPPNPAVKNSGKCSKGIDTDIEYIKLEQELAEGRSKKQARGGAIGLGYRVPMIIASPWTKGGKVCSEIFDHTSTLQFLEKFLTAKYKRNISSQQISNWRRTICGDLTSVFDPENNNKPGTQLPFIQRDTYLEDIHQSQFKDLPKGFGPYTQKELTTIKNGLPLYKSLIPQQEAGIRPSAILPYELYVDGTFQNESLTLMLKADNTIFGKKSAGAPFTVYNGDREIRSYAVKPGDSLTDRFDDSSNNGLDIQIHGPNGFFRRFKNKGEHPEMTIAAQYDTTDKGFTGNLKLIFENKSKKALTFAIKDKGYGRAPIQKKLEPHTRHIETIDLASSFHWYDLEITVDDYIDFLWAYAGRIEAGSIGYTDPQIGRV